MYVKRYVYFACETKTKLRKEGHANSRKEETSFFAPTLQICSKNQSSPFLHPIPVGMPFSPGFACLCLTYYCACRCEPTNQAGLYSSTTFFRFISLSFSSRRQRRPPANKRKQFSRPICRRSRELKNCPSYWLSAAPTTIIRTHITFCLSGLTLVSIVYVNYVRCWLQGPGAWKSAVQHTGCMFAF